MNKISEKVFAAVDPIVSNLGYEIVDVEFESKKGESTLTIYIDKVPVGVSLDDCETVSRALDPILDELDPTSGSPYAFNVSSPGLDRPFKKQRDFERNYGKEVEVKLYAPLLGKKIYEGVLIKREENVTIIKDGDVEHKIENSKIALVRPLVKFE
jgi:ribosome maturation factor RimP